MLTIWNKNVDNMDPCTYKFTSHPRKHTHRSCAVHWRSGTLYMVYHATGPPVSCASTVHSYTVLLK